MSVNSSTLDKISRMQGISKDPNRTPEQAEELALWKRNAHARVGNPRTAASQHSLISIRTTDTPLTAMGSVAIDELMRAMDETQGQWRNLPPSVVSHARSTASISTVRGPAVNNGKAVFTARNGHEDGDYIRQLVKEQNEMLQGVLETELKMRRYFFERSRGFKQQ